MENIFSRACPYVIETFVEFGRTRYSVETLALRARVPTAISRSSQTSTREHGGHQKCRHKVGLLLNLTRNETGSPWTNPNKKPIAFSKQHVELKLQPRITDLDIF